MNEKVTIQIELSMEVFRKTCALTKSMRNKLLEKPWLVSLDPYEDEKDEVELSLAHLVLETVFNPNRYK